MQNIVEMEKDLFWNVMMGTTKMEMVVALIVKLKLGILVEEDLLILKIAVFSICLMN